MKKGYDPDCEELAAKFLDDAGLDVLEDRYELAQLIQTTIEDFIDGLEHPGGKTRCVGCGEPAAAFDLYRVPYCNECAKHKGDW